MWLSPMMRMVEVTIRLPGTRIAPATSTSPCCQTRREKQGAKGTTQARNAGSRSSMAHFNGSHQRGEAIMARIFISLAESFDTFEALAASSTLVVVGIAGAQETVMEEHTRPGRGSVPSPAVDSTISDFSVERSLIGIAPAAPRVIQPGGIGPDGTVWNVDHFPLFTPGDRYLLFLAQLHRPNFSPDLYAPVGCYHGGFTVDNQGLVNPLSAFWIKVKDMPLEDVVAAIQRGLRNA